MKGIEISIKGMDKVIFLFKKKCFISKENASILINLSMKEGIRRICLMGLGSINGLMGIGMKEIGQWGG